MALSEIDVDICNRLAALNADCETNVAIAGAGEIAAGILESIWNGFAEIDSKLLCGFEDLFFSSNMTSRRDK